VCNWEIGADTAKANWCRHKIRDIFNIGGKRGSRARGLDILQPRSKDVKKGDVGECTGTKEGDS